MTAPAKPAPAAKFSPWARRTPPDRNYRTPRVTVHFGPSWQDRRVHDIVVQWDKRAEPMADALQTVLDDLVMRLDAAGADVTTLRIAVRAKVAPILVPPPPPTREALRERDRKAAVRRKAVERGKASKRGKPVAKEPAPRVRPSRRTPKRS